jgi:phosphoglycerate kinase
MVLNWLKSLKLNKKRIFLRVDLNIPLNISTNHDFKLEAILPTIDFILKNEGKIVLATHIGRPKPGNKADLLEYSTKILMPWFIDHGYKIDYEPDLIIAVTKSHQKPESILLIENLRFFVGESESSTNFAQLLSNMADLYVNDAFGNIHRSDTSTTLLAQQFAPENRALGLLIEKELTNLEKIRLNKSENFVVLLGGNKIKDKIAMLENFMQNTDKQKAKAFIIGGAIALAFCKAKGLNVGSIQIDEETLACAKKILNQAQQSGVEVILPLDQVVNDKFVKNSKTEIFDIEKIPSSAKCIDIGPKSIKLFSSKINNASVIFANGPMGIYETKEGEIGTKSILQAVADSHAFSVIGGGDLTAAVHMFGLAKKMSFLSTGGGATLKYLGCKDPYQEMPGLKAMLTGHADKKKIETL